ncbi:glycoside hydrolase family 32 protein [Salirhabdus salicampi]|uniref:glycoside hydrolase family 32 protein n=1 Tax=Salirhabdus salicampi TaxID=476102 RepID=UPI0020C31AE0|nr:sucrose-6-phosphate hydrolase [Salirhabdus salicampi]MCP8616752.1 sucrose-6-phosphate hydrolase [Salirhabdus salicampi]
MNRQADKQLRNEAIETYEQHCQKVEEDRYRLDYHIVPPVGLINDPNGFVQWNGVYHMFYQWMPFKTGHGAKFWGHFTSDDLIHWRHEPIALTPSDWFDKNGCYSGSAIIHNNQMYLFYTGNVKDDEGNRETYQCLAVSKDGIYFEKKGPVIELPSGYTAHFRDPKVWREGDRWYMIIGAQSESLHGKAVMFQSFDLYSWEHLGPITGSHEGTTGDLGYMWECPDLFELGGRDVLIVSPQGLEEKGWQYKNVFQVGYFIGEWNRTSHQFQHEGFRELDRGFEFYAPQTTLDENGRRILIGWMGVPEQNEHAHPTIDHHWIHALTVPRELQVVDDKLYQRPIEELKQLRLMQQFHETIHVANEGKAIHSLKTGREEIIINLLENRVESFSIQLGTYGSLSYDDNSQLFTFTRKSIVGDENEVRQCEVATVEQIRIFVDNSSVELFINNGEEVFTSRAFPTVGEQSIRIDTAGEIQADISIWTLHKLDLQLDRFTNE